MRNILSIVLLLVCSLVSIDLIGQTRKSDQELMDESYLLKEKDFKVANLNFQRGMNISPTLYSIERCKNETKVTFLQPIYWDRQWIYFSPEYMIVDRRSGDRYKVRSLEGGIPLQLFTIKGFNGKYIFLTFIFPKLKKKVKYIDIVDIPSPKDESSIPSNRNGKTKTYYNIKVDDYLVAYKKKYEIFK